MRLSVKSLAPLLWVIALAFLAVRMTEVHWHLCFDGQEPRSSVHVGDQAEHHGSNDSKAEHLDTDVSVTGQLLSKVVKIDSDDLPLALLGALLICAFLARPSSRLVPFSRAAVLMPVAPAFLRPPLRGPPL